MFALMLLPNALFGRIFLGQRLGRQLLVGVGVAMIGVTLLFLREIRIDPHGPGEVLTGIGFTTLAIFSASTANVMQGTRTARAYPMNSTLAVAMLIGAAFDATFATHDSSWIRNFYFTRFGSSTYAGFGFALCSFTQT